MSKSKALCSFFMYRHGAFYCSGELVQNRVVLDFSKPDTDRAEWEG